MKVTVTRIIFFFIWTILNILMHKIRRLMQNFQRKLSNLLRLKKRVHRDFLRVGIYSRKKMVLEKLMISNSFTHQALDLDLLVPLDL